VKEIRDLIRPEFVFLEVPGQDKYTVIHNIIELMSRQPGLDDPVIFEQEVVRREQEIPTGLQMGTALPHARSRVVKEIVMAFARLEEGVDFGASDQEPARLIFLFGVPNNQINDYLKLVAKLCRLVKVKSFRKKLLAAKSPEVVIGLLQEA
jgi:fructose-specific phosphotransferase system IIA component